MQNLLKQSDPIRQCRKRLFASPETLKAAAQLRRTDLSAEKRAFYESLDTVSESDPELGSYHLSTFSPIVLVNVTASLKTSVATNLLCPFVGSLVKHKIAHYSYFSYSLLHDLLSIPACNNLLLAWTKSEHGISDEQVAMSAFTPMLPFDNKVVRAFEQMLGYQANGRQSVLADPLTPPLPNIIQDSHSSTTSVRQNKRRIVFQLIMSWLVKLKAGGIWISGSAVMGLSVRRDHNSTLSLKAAMQRAILCLGRSAVLPLTVQLSELCLVFFLLNLINAGIRNISSAVCFACPMELLGHYLDHYRH